jgi:hypothetical protein
MKNDPIVQQVRDTKDQLAAAFDYDVARIFADLRSREKLVGDRLKDRRKSPNKPIGIGARLPGRPSHTT